jgi:hypothetical protein
MYKVKNWTRIWLCHEKIKSDFLNSEVTLSLITKIYFFNWSIYVIQVTMYIQNGKLDKDMVML